MQPRLIRLIVFDLLRRDHALTKASAALEEPMKAKMSIKPDSMHGLKASQDRGTEDSHRRGAKLVETAACRRHAKKTNKKCPRCEIKPSVQCCNHMQSPLLMLLVFTCCFVLFVSFCLPCFVESHPLSHLSLIASPGDGMVSRPRPEMKFTTPGGKHSA